LEEWRGVLLDLESSHRQFGFAILLFKDFQRLQLEVEFRNTQDRDLEELIDRRVQEALQQARPPESGVAMPPLSYDAANPEMSGLISRFLTLIRDYYRQADKAAFFLEHHAGKTHILTMANLRDVLSHFATMLDPATSAEQRREQLINAEEHMRRAIIEPYEIALGAISERFVRVHDEFNKKTRSLNDKAWQVKRAEIERKLSEIREDAEKGRFAKTVPLGCPLWDEGVAALINAYDGMATLHSQMEEYLYANETPKRKNGILLIAAGVILGLVCALLLRKFGCSGRSTTHEPSVVRR